MIKKKIIVTGGDGMVGKQMSFGTKLNRTQLDILNPASIEKAIAKYKPEVIVHLAALTDMMICEQNPSLAKRVNVMGAKNIAKACKKHGIKLAYLSTCAVFNGRKKTPYLEADKPNPLNVYGQTKLYAELEIQKLLPNALIIRTGWLFGGGKNIDKKFVGLTITKMNNDLDVDATADRFGSPTYIPDLLQTIHKLIIKNEYGVFHVVNTGSVTYFEIAKTIKNFGGFKSKINPVSYKAVESKDLARGKMEALSSSKIKLRSWRSALKSYLSTTNK